jgi:hypothetical protein
MQVGLWQAILPIPFLLLGFFVRVMVVKANNDFFERPLHITTECLITFQGVAIGVNVGLHPAFTRRFSEIDYALIEQRLRVMMKTDKAVETQITRLIQQVVYLAGGHLACHLFAIGVQVVSSSIEGSRAKPAVTVTGRL